MAGTRSKNTKGTSGMPAQGKKRALAEADPNVGLQQPPAKAAKGKKNSSRAHVPDDDGAAAVPAVTSDDPAFDPHPKGLRGPGNVLMTPEFLPMEVADVLKETHLVPHSWTRIDATPGRTLSLGSERWRKESNEWIRKNIKALSRAGLLWLEDEDGHETAHRRDVTVLNFAIRGGGQVYKNGKDLLENEEPLSAEEAAKEEMFKSNRATEDYDWMCWALSPFRRDEDEDECSEDEEPQSKAKDDKTSTSAVKPCGCPRIDDQDQCRTGTRADRFPDHRWVFTKKGADRLQFWIHEALVRDQDQFDMHVYNDFSGYGVVEVMENQMKVLGTELRRAKKNQDVMAIWAELEGIALFVNRDDFVGQALMVDDSERICDLIRLQGTAFMTAVDILIAKKVLDGDDWPKMTKLRNLGVVVTLLASYAASLDDDLRDEAEGWVEALLTTADEHAVDISETDDYKEFVGLPWDSWNFKKEFDEYTEKYRPASGPGIFGRQGDKSIGGRHYDITTWSKRDKEESAFSDGGIDLFF